MGLSFFKKLCNLTSHRCLGLRCDRFSPQLQLNWCAAAVPRHSFFAV